MEDRLYNAQSIEVKGSAVHGYGVFATKDIKQRQIIEECYYIILSTPFKGVDDVLKDYVFISDNLGSLGESSAMVLGCGSIYNYSINNNAAYKQDKKRRVYSFYATKDISEGEELTIDYGEDSYSAKRIREKAEGITWM